MRRLFEKSVIFSSPKLGHHEFFKVSIESQDPLLNHYTKATISIELFHIIPNNDNHR